MVIFPGMTEDDYIELDELWWKRTHESEEVRERAKIAMDPRRRDEILPEFSKRTKEMMLEILK